MLVPAATPQPPRQTVEQLLRRAQVTSFAEELDLSLALDLTPQVLQVLTECMPKLKRLILHGTNLQVVPEGVARLQDLRELNLSSCELTALPSALVLLSNLQHLNVAKNHLQELPAAFGGMPSLRLLNANNNRLQRLPDSFGQLSQLRVLRLGANALDALPASFGQLSGLRLLQLGHNAFNQFPSVLARLERLSVLDMSHNKLTTLPDFLRAMSALATLNVTGNPLRQVPTPLALPQELRITGVYSILADGSDASLTASAVRPLPPVANLSSEHTEPNITSKVASTPRPEFNGPQGQLDVTGIFLAGLLPGNNDLEDQRSSKSSNEAKGQGDNSRKP